ncbi:MAG: serine hydrolase, partial [Stackebrandtia sp.]
MTDAVFSSSTVRVLDARLANAQARGRMPSVVAAAARDGALAWSGARGRVDGARPSANTQYR